MPDTVRLYAVGDIHGRADLLDAILLRIDADRRDHPGRRFIEVFLGDYIDRGPKSRQVLERLVTRAATVESVHLKGNHEAFLTRFLAEPESLETWGRFGGLETLASYDVAPPGPGRRGEQAEAALRFARALPRDHRALLDGLALSLTCGDYFFAHAGVRPGVALNRQRESDLLQIRHRFLQSEAPFGKVVVHGHTPVLRPEVLAHRINVDTGAYATGRLTCLVLEGAGVTFLQT